MMRLASGTKYIGNIRVTRSSCPRQGSVGSPPSFDVLTAKNVFLQGLKPEQGRYEYDMKSNKLWEELIA
jgi:hypothetical protein